jgi:hypothetical protein
MKNYLSLASFVILTLGSCCTSKEAEKNLTINWPDSVLVFPRDSSVKIEKRINITKCDGADKAKCVTGNILMLGSGVVVRNCDSYSLVLTASHVCEKKWAPPVELSVKVNGASFVVIDLNETQYVETEILIQDPGLDVCVIKTRDLKRPPVELSLVGPKAGMKVYNISAPAGLYGKDMAFITDGYYLGPFHSLASYSIYAYGGSSGSMIINSSGKLVGMVHSVSREVNHVSFSPIFSDLKRFLDENTRTCHKNVQYQAFSKIGF